MGSEGAFMSMPDWGSTTLPLDGSGYSVEEKRLRDAFVKEMLVDQNPVKAAIRIGYHQSFAIDIAKQFLEEPYVQVQLRKGQDAINIDDPETAEQCRNRVIAALFNEASYTGPGAAHSARVAALGKLAELLGMGKNAKGGTSSEGAEIHVMEVPAKVSVDDWETAAVSMQAKLKEEVRQ